MSVPRSRPTSCWTARSGESSAIVAERHPPRPPAPARAGRLLNGRLAGALLLDACALDAGARRAMSQLAATKGMTARGIHRALRVARTIADLEGRPCVGAADVTAAVGLREDGATRLAA
ncbi:MAG: hypothetical protein U0667_16345 [Chloroflexota bacterium]